jgi:hypothetical protein
MNTTPTESAVLSRDEARRRADLLTVLREALAKRSVEAIVVTRRRIVLRADFSGGPSGPTDPALYMVVDGRAGKVANTDGTRYKIVGCGEQSVTDPNRAAEMIAGSPGLARRVV